MIKLIIGHFKHGQKLPAEIRRELAEKCVDTESQKKLAEKMEKVRNESGRVKGNSGKL